jgi:hypothetical protein
MRMTPPERLAITFLHAVNMRFRLHPVCIELRQMRCFRGGNSLPVSACGQNAVDCQHGERTKQNGPNFE